MTTGPVSVPSDPIDIRGLLAGARPAWRWIGLVALVSALVTAAVLAFRPARYRGTLVVVPVGGQRAALRLPDAAAFLGGSLQLGGSGGGFESTGEVVAYLVRSRTVLLEVAATAYRDGTLAEAIAGIRPEVNRQENLLSALRRRVRTVVSRETGFVTITLEGRDTAAVRNFLTGVVAKSQALFSDVARSQARELVRSQSERLDSARSTLRSTEAALLGFDQRNRVVAPRTGLALERTRLERNVAGAAQVLQLAQADWQAAVAAELQEAPALAVVERLPPTLAPWPRRVVLRSVLVALAILALGSASLLLVRLLASPSPAR